MSTPEKEPSGYLLMLVRTFDSEPIAFHADRRRAYSEARKRIAAYDPSAPARGEPEKGHGRLGPPGIISRVLRVTVIPFVDGLPAEGRKGLAHFVPVSSGEDSAIGTQGRVPGVESKYIEQPGIKRPAGRRSKKGGVA